ncbi:2-oxoglutarate receptor 1 [Trichoplax sp. H2]|nr:2-oxoglutarate receptor 1 [Trichoplax sp. H2]|eukprot:RDD36337.1 2-oxoglutarate receptor 1 [Trichoplax sp. H2]
MNTNYSIPCFANNCRNFGNATAIIRPQTFSSLNLLVIVTGIVGIILNTILLIGFYTKRSFHKPTYCLLANLAICDVLLGLASLSNFAIISLASRARIPANIFLVICKLFSVFPVHLSYTASIQTLTMISSERYLAIFRPNSELTRRKAIILCLIAWIISLCISFPFIITTSITTGRPFTRCIAFKSYTSWTSIIYVILFVGHFVLPAVIITTLYSLILRRLSEAVQGHSESSSSKKLKRKTIYMLLTTTTLFFSFYTMGIIVGYYNNNWNIRI